jgi:hypothetical protein
LPIELTAGEKIRVTAVPHHSGELPWNDATRAMNKLLRQCDRRRQIVPRRCHSAGDRRDRWMIGRFGFGRVEPDRQIGTACEHGHVALRMLVVRMRQAADERPLVASLCQAREMLADEDSRCLGGDCVEFATDLGRRVRLGIETLVLC